MNEEQIPMVGEPLPWPEVHTLRPDRHFDTMACEATELGEGLALLEGGTRCTLLDPAWVTHLLEGAFFDRCALYKTMELDQDGKVHVERLRTLLREPARAGLPRVVLNRWAGPYLCRPLGMGADAVIEDVRQWIAPPALPGDSTLSCWALITRSAAVEERLGVDECACLGEGASWLPLMAAMAQRRSDTALVVAHFLAAHPRVRWVSYPGLPDDVANVAARSTLEHGFGPLVSFAAEGCGEVAPEAAWGRSSLGRGTAAGTWVFCAGLESPLDCVEVLERWLAEAAYPA